ncbi:hypothetical protein [Ponticaulis profundi]|uniref:DUF2628 domain-containing protein n=1 Tax=Ponticaulis profundi TaxID=2665222 RepID=A0ABW1SCQ6_9PROT|tara:strand:- start:58 stop:459 length:402 start_codon:yes stop_codon:yes gene_type:complete
MNIKSLWDYAHFGQFESDWNGPVPEDANPADTLVEKRCLYESHIFQKDGDWRLVTRLGGYFGHLAFYMMLPVYMLIIGAFITGSMTVLGFLLFEVSFIVVLGWLNGYAAHELVKRAYYQEAKFGWKQPEHIAN